MSKTKRIVSLAIALAALVTASWWTAKTFWLTAPPTHSTQMIAYGEMEGGRCLGCPVVYVGEEHLGDTQIKGPVPLSMPVPPYTPLAKKNKVEGAIGALLDVDTRGNVAGVRLTTVDLSRGASAGLEQGVIHTVRTWKFKPATEKGKPTPATVDVRVSFSLHSL